VVTFSRAIIVQRFTGGDHSTARAGYRTAPYTLHTYTHTYIYIYIYIYIEGCADNAAKKKKERNGEERGEEREEEGRGKRRKKKGMPEYWRGLYNNNNIIATYRPVAIYLSIHLAISS